MNARGFGTTRVGGESTVLLGLTKAQLHPTVERLAGEAVASFQVRIKHKMRGHHGFGGAKAIPTFTYVTRRGAGEVTVFVKASDDENRREERNYAHLAKLGAPIPMLYGSIDRPDGTMVMFIEHIQALGECMPFRQFFAQPDQILGALAALARFNAIQPDRRDLASLDTGDCWAFMKNVPPVLEELWRRAACGELGRQLKSLCKRYEDALSRLKARPTAVAEQVAEMEVGLCHRDFNADCVGWRRGSNEAVIFDLESVGLAPRLEDVADWCGAPPEAYLPCLSPRQLAGHYLKHYTRWGGSPLTVQAFLRETRTLWEFRVLGMLWFFLGRAIDGQVDFTSDRRKGRSVYRRKLHADLQGLLRVIRDWPGDAP